MAGKRVIVVHGYEGGPTMHWYPWLKEELERHKFHVFVPQMLGGQNPQAEVWVRQIAETIGTPDEKTYFVGHSVGCIAICRYLATLSASVKIGGCVFVAGFIEDTEPALRNFVEPRVDMGKVKEHTHKFVVIANRDDEAVPFARALELQHELGAKLLIEDGKGHFCAEDGITEMPSVVKEILNMRMQK